MERMVQFYNRDDEPTTKVEFEGTTVEEIETKAQVYMEKYLSNGSWYEVKRYNKAIMEKYGI